MKRFFVVILLVCLALTGCSGVKYTAHTYQRAYFGSGDGFGSEIELVRSLDDLEKFRIEAQIPLAGNDSGALGQLNTYTNEFFEAHDLILISLWETSGSSRLSVKGLSFSDGTVQVNLKRKSPQVGTDDMCPWAFIIECEKNAEIEKAEYEIV